MGIGIIGAAMLGGAEGAGQGAAVAGKNWTTGLLEEAKQQAIGLREENLARLNNQAAMERTQTDIGAREHLEKDVRQPFEAGQHEADRALRGKEAELTRASHEAVAKLNRDTQVAIAKMHGSVTVGEGNKILWVGANGETKETGFTAQKDLPPSAKVAADVLRDQLKGIDKAEQDVMNATPEQQQKFAQQRLRVNGQLLAVLSGDLNKAFTAPSATPTEQDIALLKGNPGAKALFDGKFGAGAADKVLGSNEKETPHAALPLADYPPGSAEAEAAKPKPEGLIARKRRQLDEKKTKDEERKREYGDSGY